ncbi:nicotinamide riboside kinase 1 isoform X2 [Aquarana catesbeiana]|uniref:nicotinamide riboside kinase 1 isoform X2 n=1 Tax=Aquarana catesbeiana TaxID=8400 RepID=UPI003CCA0FAF
MTSDSSFIHTSPPPGTRKNIKELQAMKTFIVGIGGVTNGGKTTLANELLKGLSNCSKISQDDYFKPDAEVATNERGFKRYDELEALEMEKMMSTVQSWISQHNKCASSEDKLNIVQERCENTVHFLVVEGFLLYHYDSRVYQPPDPPGYFDGYVWPMYLKHKKEMDKVQRDIVFIDGTKPQGEILCFVNNDIKRAALDIPKIYVTRCPQTQDIANKHLKPVGTSDGVQTVFCTI